MEIDTSSKSGAGSMLPIGIALLGVVLGGIALLVSLNAASKKDVTDLTSKVSDMSGKLDPMVAAEQDLDSKVKTTSDGLNTMRTQVQTYLGQLSDAINADRKTIEAQGATLEKMTGRSGGSAKSGGSAEAASNVVPGQGGTHVIASGETFGKLATKYGVTVAAIEAANPSIDPTKLKVGDKIKIPAGKGSSPKTSTASSAPEAPAPAATATTSP